MKSEVITIIIFTIFAIIGFIIFGVTIIQDSIKREESLRFTCSPYAVAGSFTDQSKQKFVVCNSEDGYIIRRVLEP
jgi:hypothetical protein